MNAEYVNPFIQGSQRVIEQVCGKRPGLGKVLLRRPPHDSFPVCISISIIGDLKGNAIYTMPPATGLFIASKMMMSEIKELDFMSQSALCELANMISGNVATIFSEKEIKVDIGPPEYFADSFPNVNSNVVTIPLSLESGNVFEVGVCL